MITKEQCRAARSLLSLKQAELAEACGVSKTAITNFESGAIAMRQDTQKLLLDAFEKRGIQFIGDYGVQKRQASFKVLDINADEIGLPTLWDDIFETLKDTGGEILISHLEERESFQRHPEELTAHLKRLKDHKITERLLVCEGSTFFIQEPECYRWLPENVFHAGISSFIYGNKIALQFWKGDLILIIEHPEIYQDEKQRFEYLWENAIIPPYDKILPKQDTTHN